MAQTGQTAHAVTRQTALTSITIKQYNFFITKYCRQPSPGYMQSCSYLSVKGCKAAMNKKYDAIIVGGGPAGGTAA
jgi:hypothetical protein